MKAAPVFVIAGVALVGLTTAVVVAEVGLPGTSTETVVAPVESLAQSAPVLERPQAASRQGARAANVDPGWVRRTAAGTGISERAVQAYGAAVLGLPKGCELGWTTLAGIGWVESQHGTIDDRTLGADGRSSEPILGPALDGEKFKAIPATPATTALHGNPRWDHAMGPMQFIPSTWSTWARDGDHDGVEDPHDLDDAAAATAAYLCHGDRDLTTSSGWNAAVFSYNHDNAYVVAVHAAANRYGRAAD